MFKICVIIGILKIKVFNFSVTERVKQNEKNSKTITQNLNINKFENHNCKLYEHWNH